MQLIEKDNKKYIDCDWIYDIETYGNTFTFTIVRSDGKHMKVFEISDRKNEIEGLLGCFRYLITEDQRMVGFNNVGFDYPVIHHIIKKAMYAKRKDETLDITAQEMYNIAQNQIDSFKGEGFGNTIRDKDVLIKQVDLYKIHHFDNKAKATSLKMLEFNMKADNIEDLPFPIGSDLTPAEMDTLIEYNKHDVWMTLKFYYHSIDAIVFRMKLTEQLNRDFTNHNDTKVGKDYFIMKLESSVKGSCYKQVGKRRVVNQSKREFVNINECLLDYYDFKSPEFKAIYDWFKEQTITETKGVFLDIEEHNLGDVANYASLRVKRKKFKTKPTEDEIVEFKKEHPLGWIEEKELKSPKGAISYWMNWRVTSKMNVNGKQKEGTLNVVKDGFRFDFGTGGLHGSLNNAIVRADDDYMIIDYDVASYYPNLAIANRIYPEHLGEHFCDIYEDVYNQRKSYAKGTPENALMKLALNGVYGDSNNPYSPFYDSKYMLAITINGQLSLCMLTEQLLEVEGITMVQANTDGITIKCPRDKSDLADKIVADWEKDTKLQMERADYTTMILRDVNNYLAVYTDGKVKRKGAYQYEGLGWHQNQSALVVQMAAEAVMLHSKDLPTFIYDHENKWDFMLRTKVQRNSRLVLVKDEKDIPQQNICRYYPSKNGGKLIKIMPPLPDKEDERRLSIDKEWNVATCNDVASFKWNVDYLYYIEAAKKLIIEEIKEN